MFLPFVEWLEVILKDGLGVLVKIEVNVRQFKEADRPNALSDFRAVMQSICRNCAPAIVLQ